jgi:hypothetical protein
MIAIFSKKVKMNIVVIEEETEREIAKQQYPDAPIFTKKEIGILQKNMPSDSTLKGICILKAMFDGELIE